MNLQSVHESTNRILKKSSKSITDEMQQCIDVCLECHRTCEQVIPYCLEKGGTHAERGHIETLFSCAEICRTSAHLMMWNSDFHAKVCGVCADACIRCAEDCERMSEDEAMSNCAEVCRQCADSCQKMATRH